MSWLKKNKCHSSIQLIKVLSPVTPIGDLLKDGEGLRHFLNRGFNMVVAQSFAKIMGLYGERCGALHVVTSGVNAAANSASQIKALIR